MPDTHKTIGKYEIIEEIGRGGFATVYRARDMDLDREVAIKVLNPLLMRDPVWVQRFRREARAVARLDHPRIVTIYDIGQTEGVLYIAMKLIRGPGLDEIISQTGGVSWPETMQYIDQIADALDYAHEQGVLHRDLKPANVLVSPRSGAVLTDFGFARIVADNSLSMSVSGGVVGTPAYIAPEIWGGKKATPQTDIYALACLTYELYMGKPLFGGETPLQVLNAINEGPKFPAAWPEDAPPGLTQVLTKALAKDPSQRHASAGAFVQDLREQEEAARQAEEEAARRAELERQRREEEAERRQREAERNKREGKQARLALLRKLKVPETVRVPAGEFLMGSTKGHVAEVVQRCIEKGYTKAACKEWYEPELPQHRVYVDAFEITKYPITVAQFEAFVKDTGYRTTAEEMGSGWVWTDNRWEEVKGADWRHPYGPDSDVSRKANHPVTQVSWHDAIAYCQWLSEKTGQHWRLPTEAEWEKAARGTDGRIYPWGNESPNETLCNYNGNVGDTTPVESYPAGASPYGALDMAGNVWEWVADWYDADYYTYSPARNPTGPGFGSYRVLRGGSWYNSQFNVRSAFRFWLNPGYRLVNDGFRCVAPSP